MKKAGLLLLLLFTGFRTPGQDSTVRQDDDLLRSAEQWAKANLDENALRVLQSADRDKVRQVLEQVRKQFQGKYVVDLAQLKAAVRAVLPLLEAHKETLPYAVWLKTRRDYFPVADQLRVLVPPPKTAPGQPAKPAPNPPPQKEREVWMQQLAERPWPKHSKQYVARLKPIFTAEKVPPELVWLAEVESSFDPRARSPVGAAGLFQLMPDTARHYGLRMWPLDQRLTPETSGRAAARYLHDLRGRFKDWRLALAAYNAGEGTVQNLLARRKAATFDAIADRLPAETQMFVPKVEATLYRREGLKLSQLQPPSLAKHTP